MDLIKKFIKGNSNFDEESNLEIVVDKKYIKL